MINNYYIDKNGVVCQDKINNKMKYNKEYIDRSYNTYKEKVINMSYLRLGYILGTIGYTPHSILDIGYGNGEFLNECVNIIPECYGHDISNYNLPDNVTFVDDILKNEYDVITFFDSLEHFEDISFVSKLQTNYIVISVPDCHYYNDDWFYNWKHRKEDEHLYHFNSNSLMSFFNNMGYDMIRISNIEDIIRKGTKDTNILTGVFRRKL